MEHQVSLLPSLEVYEPVAFNGSVSTMFDEKLIALVRQYTVLYDMSDPRYIDHKHKMKVWKLIGITLDMPGMCELLTYILN